MVSVIWTPPDKLTERHVVVHAHRDGMPAAVKGYFFLSDESDWGGAGPFDMRLDEVIERAKQRASEQGLLKVVVVRKP